MADGQVKDEWVKGKRRREPSRLASRWRFFWMRRSGWRTMWALILAIPALLALIYLALPAEAQAPVVAAIQVAAQALGATGLRVAVEAALVGCTLISFALLFAPGYRRYPYLNAPTSDIPRRTYLLDFENMAGNPHGELLLRLMLERLRSEIFSSRDFSQRRADLLYFMSARHLTAREAAEEADKNKDTGWVNAQNRLNRGYNELYLNGFHLVDSPHKVIPRQDSMKEAVDRAIELFALERALLGGFKQKFVIISGDGDYAPLIYRLVTLGHDVEVWMWGNSEVYEEVGKRIPLTVIALLPPDPEVEAHKKADTKKDSSLGATSSTNGTSSPSHPHVEIAQPELKPLYEAIYHTVEKYRSLAPRATNREIVHEKLVNYLDHDAKRRQELLVVGYDGKSSRSSWLRSMDAIGAFGEMAPEQAARLHFSMALAVAHALVSARRNPEGRVETGNVLNTLATSEIVGADAKAALTVIIANTRNRAIDVRFLELCARALGIVEFASEPARSDVVGNPRLTALGERLLAEESGRLSAPPAAPGAPEMSV